MTTMKRITDRIERTLFGATTEERIALQTALIDRRIDRALDRLADALLEDDEAEDTTGNADTIEADRSA